MHEKYDAVVVGGGPAGSIAAKTLAAAGVNTGLVDKDHKRIKPCGGATPSRSFEEFDLSPNEIVKKILTISTFSPRGDKTQVSLDGGYLALVERGPFDNSLRKKAEKAGTDLIEAEFLRIKEWQGPVCIT
ncbi:MAG: FAD-dependent monooxygenase, partial [Nitrospirae bacterium]|nr:FAD-dependent monooxygenase [Nitrospirota bacterium]